MKGLHEKLAIQAELNNELKRSLSFMSQEDLKNIKHSNKKITRKSLTF